MTEHKLFHIYIRPKNNESEDAEVYDFRIVAEKAIDALGKLMMLPDIDYMYSEQYDEIVIEYDGTVY